MVLKKLRAGKTTTDIAKEFGRSIERAAELVTLFAGKRKSWETPPDTGRPAERKGVASG